MDIPPEDLRIDLIQTNLGDIVRVTHLPTGASVTVTDGDSLAHKRDQAMRKLMDLLADT